MVSKNVRHTELVSSFRFQVSSFRFQVSGFRFQVSGFRFTAPKLRLYALPRLGVVVNLPTLWRGRFQVSGV